MALSSEVLFVIMTPVQAVRAFPAGDLPGGVIAMDKTLKPRFEVELERLASQEEALPHMRGRKAVLVVAVAAVLFGVVTAIAGARALFGEGPGYVVYLPLLRFNTIMGIAYVAVGVIAWRNLKLAVYGAAAICVLNLFALGLINYFYTPNGPIAGESLQAMTFRTIVWLVLFLALAWASRGNAAEK